MKLSEKDDETSRMMMAGHHADHLGRHVGADVHQLRALAQIAIEQRHDRHGQRPAARHDGDEDALEGEVALEQHGQLAVGLALHEHRRRAGRRARPTAVIAETMMKVDLDAGIFGEAGIVPDQPELQPPAGAIEREPDERPPRRGRRSGRGRCGCPAISGGNTAVSGKSCVVSTPGCGLGSWARTR